MTNLSNRTYLLEMGNTSIPEGVPGSPPYLKRISNFYVLQFLKIDMSRFCWCTFSTLRYSSGDILLSPVISERFHPSVLKEVTFTSLSTKMS